MRQTVKIVSILICIVGFYCNAFAAKVDTLTIQSAVMRKGIKAAVILPDAYGTSGKKFPGDLFITWRTREIQRLAFKNIPMFYCCINWLINIVSLS